MVEESRDKLKKLLKDLFQFDAQDLDFGIYKILNYKRVQITKFIDDDLIAAAEKAFKEYATTNLADLQKDIDKLVAEIRRDFGEDTIDSHGRVQKHQDAPKIKEYLGKIGELKGAELSQAKINDVYNHLYEFFSRYYDKGDFISKRRYGGKDKYSIPYNGDEVILYWANRDQYYIKTSEYFKKYSFKTGGYNVHFVLREAEVESNNVKSDKRFFVLCNENPIEFDEKKKELQIYFSYRALTDEETKLYGTRNTQDALITSSLTRLSSEISEKTPWRELNKHVNEETTLLCKHINTYVKRNTTDYFIHKNLKEFLEHELDFYLKNEVMDITEIERMDPQNIRLETAKIKAIREIAKKIIEFLSQIEDFQKKLWEKKKFVLRSEYCMTLDMVPEEFYREIGRNEQQITEWKGLFKLNETTKDALDSTKDKKTLDVEFLKSHKYLVLDTKFFNQEFKDKLLISFDNLDNAIIGLMIKSENWQALNLLQTKYHEQVKCIYIDPPYNTGIDGFNYKDNFQHSSWYSLIFDRLLESSYLLSDDGTFSISIDDNEAPALRILMNSLLQSDNFIQQIIWKKRGGPPNDKIIGAIHEYVLLYSKNNLKLKLTPRARTRDQLARYQNPDNHPKGVWAPDNLMSNVKGGRYVESLYFPIVNSETGEKHYPSSHGNWRFNKEKIDELMKNNEIYFGEDGRGRPKLKRFLCDVKEGVPYSTLWDYLPHNNAATNEIEGYFGTVNIFDTPKPTALIMEIISLNSLRNSLILDFFAGSGTTADALLRKNQKENANLRYILIEFQNYFDSVMKPRIQKLMYSTEWKNGLPTTYEGLSHLFKYIYLEQYEDTLNNIVFKELDKTIQETLYSYKDYFLRYMLDYETRESPTRLAVDKFQTPFDYKIKTLNGNEERIETVDLVETFNYLLGLHVEKLRAYKDGNRYYRAVFGKHDTQKILIIWRNTKDIDLKKDKKFIEETILANEKPNRIFINGDSYVKNAEPIEPEFKKLMGA